MRTTLTIDDDLYRRTKALAALQGVSVTSVIEGALRAALRIDEPHEEAEPLPVSTRRPGLTPEFEASGTDLTDYSAVLDFLDERIP